MLTYRFDHITPAIVENWLTEYPLKGFPPQEPPWIDAHMGNALQVFFDMLGEQRGMPPRVVAYGRQALETAGYDPDLLPDAAGRMVRLWSGFIRQYHLERVIYHAKYPVVWDVKQDHKGADLMVLSPAKKLIIKSTTSYSTFDARKALRYTDPHTQCLTLAVWGGNPETTKTVGGVFLHNPSYVIEQITAAFNQERVVA